MFAFPASRRFVAVSDAMKLNNLSGLVFGRLTVICRSENVAGRVAWKCLCKCGKMHVATGNGLLRRRTASCGCLRKEVSGGKNRSHGRTNTSEYQIWCGIKKRCFNSRSKAYPYYGGRGITMCAQWANSFESFLEAVGQKPSPLLTLDRANNNGNYEPGNVRWATRQQQALNRRQRSK